MDIILLEPIRKLGKAGDVVKVKPGFARNFLLPQSKALYATKANIAEFEAKKDDIEKTNKERHDEASAAAKKVNGKAVILTSQAGEDNRLYGSITANDIAKAVSEQFSIELDRKQIILTDTIKYIGIYDISVQLHADIEVTLGVNVARSESEAREAAKAQKATKADNADAASEAA